jgi:hypothetical protein
VAVAFLFQRPKTGLADVFAKQRFLLQLKVTLEGFGHRFEASNWMTANG